MFLDLKSVRKSFGPTLVVRGFDLTVTRGEFVSFLGPSGCGKTTTLRMIAGFELPTEGTPVVFDEAVDDAAIFVRGASLSTTELVDGIALFDPSATAETILTTELVVLGGAWAIGSIFLFRWMLPVGIGVALVTVPALAYPSVVPTLFSAANALAATGFVVGWRFRRPDRE